MKKCFLCDREYDTKDRVCPDCAPGWHLKRHRKPKLRSKFWSVFEIGFWITGTVGAFWLANFLDSTRDNDLSLFADLLRLFAGASCIGLLLLSGVWLYGLSQDLSSKWAAQNVRGIGNILVSVPAIFTILAAIPVGLLSLLFVLGLLVALWPLVIILLLLLILAKK